MHPDGRTDRQTDKQTDRPKCITLALLSGIINPGVNSTDEGQRQTNIYMWPLLSSGSTWIVIVMFYLPVKVIIPSHLYNLWVELRLEVCCSLGLYVLVQAQDPLWRGLKQINGNKDSLKLPENNRMSTTLWPKLKNENRTWRDISAAQNRCQMADGAQQWQFGDRTRVKETEEDIGRDGGTKYKTILGKWQLEPPSTNRQGWPGEGIQSCYPYGWAEKITRKASETAVGRCKWMHMAEHIFDTVYLLIKSLTFIQWLFTFIAFV